MMKAALYVLVVVIGLLFVAAALVYFLLYWSRPAAPPRVTEGVQLLRVIELDPMGLTIKDADGSWFICEEFKLRVAEDVGAKSLLIRGTFVRNFTKGPDGRLVESPTEVLEHSDYTYSVALDGSFAVSKVDEGAWSRARPLTPEESETEFGPGRHRMFTYREDVALPPGAVTKGGLPLKSLGVGGAETEGWLLSQETKYVAGFSHTSRRRPFKRPSLIPFGDDDRIADGTMYVDIFDGATGRRLAQATKGHQGSYDMYVFRQAVWFEGRYFAMPLKHDFGSWLIGVLPE